MSVTSSDSRRLVWLLALAGSAALVCAVADYAAQVFDRKPAHHDDEKALHAATQHAGVAQGVAG